MMFAKILLAAGVLTFVRANIMDGTGALQGIQKVDGNENMSNKYTWESSTGDEHYMKYLGELGGFQVMETDALPYNVDALEIIDNNIDGQDIESNVEFKELHF